MNMQRTPPSVPRVRGKAIVFYAFLASMHGTAGCWVWPRAKNPKGYGVAAVEGQRDYAHRAAYRIRKGPIPPGRVVMHICDNPGCVNPDHLSLGSHADNTRDCCLKKRHAFGARSGNAKLTEDAVRSIRADTRRQREIAAEFRVSRSTVCMIQKRRIWSHIQ